MLYLFLYVYLDLIRIKEELKSIKELQFRYKVGRIRGSFEFDNVLIVHSVESLTSIALESALVSGSKAGLLFSLFLVRVLPREVAFLLANLIARGA
jgi:hypothetical protein